MMATKRPAKSRRLTNSDVHLGLSAALVAIEYEEGQRCRLGDKDEECKFRWSVGCSVVETTNVLAVGRVYLFLVLPQNMGQRSKVSLSGPTDKCCSKIMVPHFRFHIYVDSSNLEWADGTRPKRENFQTFWIEHLLHVR